MYNKNPKDRICGKKIKHATKENAEKEAKRMRKKYGPKFNVYECGFCKCWHIGTNRSGKVQKFKKVLKCKHKNVECTTIKEDKAHWLCQDCTFKWDTPL